MIMLLVYFFGEFACLAFETPPGTNLSRPSHPQPAGWRRRRRLPWVFPSPLQKGWRRREYSRAPQTTPHVCLCPLPLEFKLIVPGFVPKFELQLKGGALVLVRPSPSGGGRCGIKGVGDHSPGF